MDVRTGELPKLPYNPDAERAVLGAVLLDNPALQTAAKLLRADDFFLPQHVRIFGRMLEMGQARQAIDLVTLNEFMEQCGELDAAGGPAYFTQLLDGLPRVTNIEYYAQIVKSKSELRTLAHMARAISEQSLEPGAKLVEIRSHLRGLIDHSAHQATSELVAISAEELLTRQINPREMLLDPILPEQGLAMLYAYRGIGKTFLALGIAAAVASGTKFLDWKAPRARKVLYVDGELPASTLRERLAMILGGMDGEPAPEALAIITPDVQTRPMPDLATIEGQRILEPHLERRDLLILDNLSALCRDGNENEGEGWLPVQEWALGLRRRGMSVLFVHHAGKNKSQRGTSRREDLLDTVITLKHPSDYNPSEGLRCEVHLEKARSIFGDAAKPFEVKMETGPDGRAIWLCRNLEEAKAEKADSLFASGLSVRDVAEELGISKSQAGRLRQKWTAEREMSRRPTA